MKNNNILDIPIVVAAFNREVCLDRLLNSLEKGVYREKVKLIISIDGEGCEKVVTLANEFHWPHGEKEVIVHAKNLGLREHILSCGQLSKLYDGIILFEDDLYVSPFFYDYAISAQDKYRDEDSVAGIALYSHQFNETSLLPFSPLNDGNDVFFMQLACSWGQSWLTSQWEVFYLWYENNAYLSLNNDPSLPSDVRRWPDTSWKKYFIKYMIEKNKFFVYPNSSYVTNFGDEGVHHKGTNLFQVPLTYGVRKSSLPAFNDSHVKYDAFCEILPDCISHYRDDLKKYDFDVNLYGVKNKENIKCKYVLTRQGSINSIKTFGRKLKPHELNIIEDMPGDCFSLVSAEQFKAFSNPMKHRGGICVDVENSRKYFYPVADMYHPPIKKLGISACFVSARFREFIVRNIRNILFRVFGV